MTVRLSAPLEVQWELTSWCSYRCTHCYNYWRREPVAGHSLDNANRGLWERTASELMKNGVFHATLTGGEPLGVLEEAYPILRGLADHGMRFSLNSNLSLLSKRHALLLQKLGVRSILTSLISADESLNDQLAGRRGAFRHTVAGIQLAVARGFEVAVNMVVSKKNYHSILETASTAKALGASTFCATKVAQPSNCPGFDSYLLEPAQTREMFMTLLRIKEQLQIGIASLEHYPACAFPDSETRSALGSRNCSAAKVSCTIGQAGDIRPCSHAPIPYGTIARGLHEGWEAMEPWRTGELIPSGCRSSCGEYPRKCGGGCRIEALTRGGALNAPDPLCQDARPVAAGKRTPSRPALPGVKVRLSSAVRFRPEPFGHVAYRSRSAWLAIEPRLYELLQTTLSGRTLDALDIAVAYAVDPEEASLTLGRLLAKGIVTTIAE